MKKIVLFILVLFGSLQTFSQLLSWTPDFPLESTGNFTITADASKGNQGLLNYTPSDVFVHIGVITNLSTNSGDWKYVKYNQNFNQPNAALQAVSISNNKWAFTISGGLRSYFGITNPAETIQKIAILFRSGNGSRKLANADGSDMFIPVYGSAVAVRIIDPLMQPTYKPLPEPITKKVGDQLTVTAVSNVSSKLVIYFNGTAIQTAASATSITAIATINTSGNQQVIAEATNGTATSRDTINFFASSTVNTAPLPAGVKEGINYTSNSSATLVLYAPGKARVSVIGEFPGNNWQEQPAFQMNKTPDGNYWWIALTGLTPGTEYAYQYLVNGTIKIADPYTEKVLDPVNDSYISAATYPSLKAYPSGLTTGIVSVLQPGGTAYNWQVNNFTRPDKRNLVIYELLVRDFVANHNWNTLRDTLSYLKKLGINAIEIMPFNEFEGNISWGYNPDFYFAPDKYYGPANTLKEFIDSCHKNGIAVIMDMVLNHSFGSSPMVQLYWDAANNRPSTDNPWFNPVAKHAYNVGYDMNHESLATRNFVSRVVTHWLADYKIDGFRFDLSKGFTQTQTCDASGANCNVAAWGNYDQSRVNIWKRYYDTLQLKSPASYCILEHFADNSEEKVLSDYGMMLWGNENYNYNQATMGYSDGWDFSYGLAGQRGWTNNNLVTYMESHDEERLMFKNLAYGNASGTYSIKDTATALKRQELAAAFFLTLPGPKMLWQFGETGYDYSINYCQNGSINNNCRVDPKPIRWDYMQQPNRRKLYDVYSKLIALRLNPLYKDAFVSTVSSQSLFGPFKSIQLASTPSKIVVIGNFDVTTQTGSVTFPVSGAWYDYLNGNTILATGNAQSFTLQPGEYHIYINQNIALPATLLNFTGSKEAHSNVLQWQTAREVNVAYYDLEKSTNEKDFSSIATIKATGSEQYLYTDQVENDFAAVTSYRLKTVDVDGKFAYSTVVTIKRSPAAWQVQVSPNPFQGLLKVKLQSPLAGKATFVVSEISGRQLLRQEMSVQVGKNEIELPGTSKFSKGTYLLSIFASQKIATIRIIKN